MENLKIKNPVIERICQTFTTLQYNDGEPSKPVKWESNDDFSTAFDQATSNKSLEDILQGHQYIKKSCYKIFGETPAGTYFLEQLKPLINYDSYYTAAYWPQGFVGWHLDSDIKGYCLLWTWSAEGSGFFKYRDPITNEIIQINDEPGWHVKAMRLGNQDNDRLWHCAGGTGSRWSFVLMYDDDHVDLYQNAKSLISL